MDQLLPMAAAGVLPASGRAVSLREPTGEDELLAIESTAPAALTMLALASRLAVAGPAPIEWGVLPAVDLSALALLIRGAWLGDTIRAEALCPAAGCEEPIDVTFGVAAYVAHHRPRHHRGVRAAEAGWFTLARSEVRFRIPTIADLVATLEDRPPEPLLARCVDPPDAPAAVLRRVDRALGALAPRLDGELGGTCPECGRGVHLRFEPIGYVLEELRGACSGLFAQVHELALAYHWSQGAILALRRRRRHRYVALLREEPAFA